MCSDCGSLLIHDNVNTLDSMKDIHSQLCIVQREKSISLQSVQEITTQPQQTLTQSTAQLTSQPSAQVSSSDSSNNVTTISLTGDGNDYSTAEGPIDVEFKSKRKNTGKFKGINVWGPVDGPGQLGIWGDNVCVDFDICVGDGACIEACPVNVYEWVQTPGHPGSEQKPLMAREKDCIFCLACENVCPPNAIKIFQKE